MFSGEPVHASAIYRPRCCVEVDFALHRGEQVPPCPRCRRLIEWRFVRTDAAARWRPMSGQAPQAEGLARE